MADTPSFRHVDEQQIHAGPVISVGSITIEGPDGERYDREVVHHPGAVSVVPLLDERTVVLVRQYRAPLDSWLLEIPAGKRDVPGEPPEETAGRELIEEVGLRAGKLEPLATFHNSPGFSDEHSLVYLGSDLEATDPAREGIEEQHLEVVHLSLDEVAPMIAAGELRDAKTIIGLLLTIECLAR